MTAIEIVGLLELVRSLMGRKADLDKEYFENFLEPTWRAFLKVHEDYKSSFRTYTEYGPANENRTISLVERIKRDSIYTADLRSELRNLRQNLPPALPRTRQSYLSAFIEALDLYFDDDSTIVLLLTEETMRIGLSFNRARILAIKNLELMGNNRNKEEARKMFDQLVTILQRKHDEVARAYFRLRKHLLK